MPSTDPDVNADKAFSLSLLENPNAKCNCVKRHVPKAMELHKHHVWPLGEGGPDTRDNLLLLCPSTHANVHMLWRLYEKYGGTPPWDILNNYSEYCRRIVEKGRELRARNQREMDRNFDPTESYSGSPPPSADTY